MPHSSSRGSGLLPAENSGRLVKQRQLRKGTFSCWECKRRKTRCQFERTNDSVCASCRRRGVDCVGQEFADPADGNHVAVAEERMAHVESLVNQLVQQRSQDSALRSDANLTSDAQVVCNPRGDLFVPNWTLNRPLQERPDSLLATGHKLAAGPRSLSCYLHAFLPDPTKAALILTRGKFSNLPVHLRGQRSTRVASSVGATEQLAQISELPSPTVHPICLARNLVQLALCLQQLEDPSYDAAQRYVEIASHFVTSQDALVDSIDGIETLMLESCYHVNVGNMRGAWLSVRRALNIAQLIGLPLRSQKPDSVEENVWFCVVLADRSLSWKMGLPPAVLDNTFANEHELQAEAWSAKLERIHAVTLGRIISRNLRMQRARLLDDGELNTYDDRKVTQDIDLELKNAKRSVPTTWWLCPTLHSDSALSNVMEKTEQLIAQMAHHFDLISLHQPYLVRKPSPTRPASGIPVSTCSPFNDVYSHVTVLSASRELLYRFILVRSFHRTLSYHGVDDKAFIAAVMFLFVHLNARRLGYTNLLEHQRPYDLGIINEVVSVMEETSSANKDKSSGSMVQALKKLLEIEAESAGGRTYSVWLEETPDQQPDYEIKEETNELSLAVPYFGSIRIAPSNLTALESTTSPPLAFTYTTELMPPFVFEAEYNSGADSLQNEEFNMSSGANLQFQPSLSNSDATYFNTNLNFRLSMESDIQGSYEPNPTIDLQNIQSLGLDADLPLSRLNYASSVHGNQNENQILDTGC